MCLVDFGVAFRLGERYGDSNLTGTIAYSAPETLLSDAKGQKLGPKVDM